MDNYDIVIIGAGIAGCSLAYNLNKMGYKGNVLLIDKKGVGSNPGYKYRIAFEEIVKKHKVPYIHKYKFFHVGAFDQIFFDVLHEVYFVDYGDLCNIFFKKSNVEFRREEAININGNILVTNKNNYRFKYLVDCSGGNSFVGKIVRRPKASIYWINKAQLIKNENKLKDKSFYYLFSNTGYFEEIYPLKDKILHAHWLYTTKPDLNLIQPHNRTFSKKIKMKGEVLEEFQTIFPVSPTFPLIFKNFIFLGDSCGNACPANGMGIKPILKSSKILAYSIMKNDLQIYNREWKKLFLEKYSRSVASKLDRYHSSEFMNNIKKYPSISEVIKITGENPEFFLNLLKDDDSFDVPNEIREIFPKRQMLFFGLEYLSIRLKYFLMDKRIIYK